MSQPLMMAKPRAASGTWFRLIPSLPLLVGLLALLRGVAQPMALLNDSDTYMHIAAGRWALAHWTLPARDVFSHTMPGAYWPEPEWLSEIALALAYAGGSWSGVVLLTGACFAVAAAIQTRFLLRRVAPLPALVASIAGSAVLLPHLLARPHILALPVLVGWCGALISARDDQRTPATALLPLMTLWANLHGSFLFGLALAAFLAAEAVLSADAGQTRRAIAWRWGRFVAMAIAASLLTPQGIGGLVQPFKLMSNPALMTGWIEWRSPDFQDSLALEIFLIGILGLGFVTGIRLPLPRLVLLAGIVHMTLQHVRHADLLGLVGPLVVAASFGPALAAAVISPATSRLTMWLARLAAPAGSAARAVALLLAFVVALPLLTRPIVRGDDATTPASALAAARRLGMTGPVLNSEEFGGYLMLSGIPTFIDGRIEMFGGEFLSEYLAAARGEPGKLIELLDRDAISWTLFPPGAVSVGILDNLPGWRRAYGDDHAVVHVRTRPRQRESLFQER